LNDFIHQWFSYYQKNSMLPDEKLRWVIGDKGPLWNRDLLSATSRLDVDLLKKILTHFKSSRVVVGHTVMDHMKESFNHPQFDSQVYMIDTGISYVYKGKLSALVIRDNKIQSYKISRKTGVASLKRSRTCESLLKSS
jgi:hypothetical protein